MSAEHTPLMRQYLELKSQNPDALLFFRLGDFYEMFFDDAKRAAAALQLVLTSRGQDEQGNRIPMCGIPYHSLKNYLPKLLQAGFKVAISEQTEDAKQAKGLTRREVVRVLTPGTLTEEDVLSAKNNNFLVAVYEDISHGLFSLACVDVSTGDFHVTQLASKTELQDEIHRLGPSELLLPEGFELGMGPLITRYKPASVAYAETVLKAHFQVNSLDTFGLNDVKSVMPPAVEVMDYLKRMQRSTLSHIRRIRYYATDDFVFLDRNTQRNLELVSALRKENVQGTLRWVLDRTKTAMGSRLLKKWILQPLRNIDKIKVRQVLISHFVSQLFLRDSLRESLEMIYDIERIVARLSNQTISPRDFIALKVSLQSCEVIWTTFTEPSQLLPDLHIRDSIKAISAEIDRVLVNEPPITITEGGLIKRGVDSDLDALLMLTQDSQIWLTQLELMLRKRCGIKNLKVGYNRINGYFIEVSNGNLSLVPSDFIRKQTLTNGERFITEELKQKEVDILSADDRKKKLEYQLFDQLRTFVSVHIVALQDAASKMANLDVILSLADVAHHHRYVQPSLNTEGRLMLKQSRHPVVERGLGDQSFTPNDVCFDNNTQFIILTGPNMAGKSTYMRQILLITLMALMGSFVPADEADISVVDRIFTRIGANDDLFSGESTFMVEMNETANILHNATKNSVIILDEIGRGTSTFDGMSIAASVAEYLYKHIGAKTIFATHYHELTSLAAQYSRMKNFTVSVEDSGHTIQFLHKVVAGQANKSYGIHVAELAGLPSEVIYRAKEFLYHLEQDQSELLKNQAQPVQLALFEL